MKFNLFRRKKQIADRAVTIPDHIAIIMDGNGRWATRRGLPRTAGHAAGAEMFRRTATYCKQIGVKYLTVYAFSTENWRRPADEVQTIMRLLEQYLFEAIEKMERDRVRMKFFGDTTVMSEKLQELIASTEEISTRFEGVQVNICLNYGGRDEIVRAVNSCMEKNGATPITEQSLTEFMYSAGVPDPDLVIRPGGEKRISNFLLWQAAYSEFYFTDTLWPDFDERELDLAIEEYSRRERRYGGIK